MSGARVGLVVAAAVLALCPAVPGGALPASLRSDDDVRDAVDAVMQAVAEGRPADGVRSLGAYSSLASRELAERTVEIQAARSGRRKRLGLAAGVEAVEGARVGERLWQLVRIQHFDRGYVVWRFLFHRPEQGWQLIDLEVLENDRSVLGRPPWGPAESRAPAASGATGVGGEGDSNPSPASESGPEALQGGEGGGR